MSGAERREGILDAAIAEFARVGYQGATIARIAAAAGCSEPNLYKHFADKRELLLASLRHAEDFVEAELDDIVLREDRLARFLAFVDSSDEYRRMLQLRMLCSTLPDDHGLLEHLRAGTERLIRRFQDGLEQGKAAGTVRPDVDPTAVAWSWLGLSLAACYAEAVHGEEHYRHVMQVARRSLLAAAAVAPDAPA